MSVFASLVEAYEAEGIETASGLNPTLTDDYFAASFTWLVRDGQSVTDGLGVAPVELYLMESLAALRPARKVFVVGNAFGWSTLALALAHPGAEVVAIDAGFDINSIEGLEVTNRIAARLGLNVRAIKATSPQDVASIIGSTLGEVDLAFVDGFHTSEQIVADFAAIAPFLTPDATVLFHDVVFCAMESGFAAITADSGWSGTVLHGTTTGIGLLVREVDPALRRVITAFAGHPAAVDVVRAEAKALAHQRGTEQRADALAYIQDVVASGANGGTVTEQTATPGEVVVRRVKGADISYRYDTTDEFVLDAEYAAVRFFPEGYVLPENGVVVDAGAHIGVFAAIVAKEYPKAAVHALEPSSENFWLLEKNVRDNGVEATVVAHQLAIGGTNGVVRLHSAPGSVGHSFYKNPDWEGEPFEARPDGSPPFLEHEDVRCQVFAEFLADNGITHIDFLKMNIEGAEYDVLLGASEELLRSIDCIQLELHPDEQGRTEALIARLGEVGFATEFQPCDDNPAVVGWLSARR